MSGESFLCEVCAYLIEYDYKLQAWVDMMGKRVRNSPSPHDHKPKEKVFRDA